MCKHRLNEAGITSFSNLLIAVLLQKIRKEQRDDHAAQKQRGVSPGGAKADDGQSAVAGTALRQDEKPCHATVGNVSYWCTFKSDDLTNMFTDLVPTKSWTPTRGNMRTSRKN